MFRSSITAAALIALGAGSASAQSMYRDAPAEELRGFGASVALLGDQAFVGEVTAAGAPGGTVHIYNRVGAEWRRTAGLTIAGLEAGALFGSSLAAEGSTLMVGMRNATDGSRGGVRVFTRSGDSWTDAGSIGTPSDGSLFGASIALDGEFAFVGAPNEQPSGAVHVFQSGDNGWTPVDTLMAEEGARGDRFGSAISASGGRVAIGAPGRDAQKGMVYVFNRGSDGSWQLESAVAGRRVPANGGLGSSLVLEGNQLWAGAPTANGFAGMVVGFANDGDGDWAEQTTVTPFELGTNRFGMSLALVDGELWVGAPFSDSREGRIYRASMSESGALLGMTKLGSDELSRGSNFGGSLAVAGATAVVGMPGDAGGAGTAIFLARGADGNWNTQASVFPQPDEMNAMTDGETQCGDNGQAGDFGCSNTSLLAFMPLSEIGAGRGVGVNDNWGWTDPESGREYALVARNDGMSFVDITDATSPRYLGDLPMPAGSNAATWRDVKTYSNHAYVVADGAGAHGVQVFDLTRLRDVGTPQTFTEDAHYDQVGSAHNIVINEETGFAYAVGVSGSAETCGGGLHMINIQSPKNPTFAGCFSDPATGRSGTGYSHDAQCVVYRGPDEEYQGREICIGDNETAISIADVTDKANPKAISNASYPNVAYAHQGWLTEDHRFYYLGDELDEQSGNGEAAKGTRTLVWDLADLDDPILLKEHVGETKAIDHNMYIKGNRLYQSNYTAGLRILDISDPANPREVGYLDTFPANDNAAFAGTWSNYPYFKSGTIVVTSSGEGLFLVRDRTQAVP